MIQIDIIVQYGSDRSGPKWLRCELLCITNHPCHRHSDNYAITILIFISFLTNMLVVNIMIKINIIVQYDSDRSGPKWLRWELLCITTSAHRGQSQGISMDTGPPYILFFLFIEPWFNARSKTD